MNIINFNQILMGRAYTATFPNLCTNSISNELSPNYAQILSRNFARSFTKRLENLLQSGQAQPSSAATQNQVTQGVQGIQGEQGFVAQVNNELQQQIYTPNVEEQKKLNDINADRAKDGKPPINFQQVTREIENIMNDPNLDEGKKKDLVGKIKDRLGLGKGDMKFLFTKRLAKLHEQAADKLNTRLESLEKNAKEMERLYGKNSPQALQANQALETSKSVLEPQKQQWEAKANSYSKMFPSFWSKLGGAFKKVVSAVTKVVNAVAPILKMIPGIGTIASLGLAAINGLNSIVHGDWKGFLKNVASNLASAVPALGSAVQMGMNAFNTVKSFAKGNIMGGLGGLMNFTGALPEKVGDILNKGWSAFGSIYSAAKGNFMPLFNTALNFAPQIPGVQKLQETWNNLQQKIPVPLNQGIQWLSSCFPF
ncbi:MAG: hypothetical protein HQM15_01030 [Deltaproteobacteria bacterium]|nr:hypothetical protein [Deltaproteobacteria bacterium]